MYRFISVLLFTLLCSLLVNSQTTERFRAHTMYLASKELRGRGTGSEDIRKAAGYIAKQFEQIGLEKHDGKSYFQEFAIEGQGRGVWAGISCDPEANAKRGSSSQIRRFGDLRDS